eukprot:SAG31_NODE_4439_length_3228_cov_1.409076_1_plen_100_part_00
MLQAYGASAATRVALQSWDEVSKGWSSKHELAPESYSTSGVSVLLPAATRPFTPYRVSTGGGGASFVTVNTPEVWWVLGDAVRRPADHCKFGTPTPYDF